MSLFTLFHSPIRDRSERCVDSLDTALAESRNDDGSLRFRESIFYRLPMHERDGYLRALSKDSKAQARATGLALTA